jgi:hypothetical protein
VRARSYCSGGVCVSVLDIGRRAPRSDLIDASPRSKIRVCVKAIYCTMVLVDTLVSGVRDVPDGDHDFDPDSVAVRRANRTRRRTFERR